MPIRVSLALALLKHELGGADEDICHRLRTDFAVMYACGLREDRAPSWQMRFVLPEPLCEFRGRLDEALLEELIAIQAAAAREEGLVSPAHLVIETFPCEQGSQRVTDATTLYKAQKKLSRCWHGSPSAQPADHPGAARAPSLHQELPKSCGALGQCRRHGHVCVTLGRHTEQQLLELGQPITALGQQTQQLLTQAPALSDATRQRSAEA